MKTLAFISDVHANLEALEEVLGHLGGMEVYCLGDLVDYGASPNEVVELAKKEGLRCIAGNHDVAVIDGDTSLFNARAAMSSKWTRKTLTSANIGYLRGLPLDLRLKAEEVEAYLAHGSPDDRLWEYVDPRTHSDLFGYYLSKTRAGLMGLGHTHVPYVWQGEGGTVFNPGSVGQPRDGDRRASFAVVRASGGAVEVEVRRVDYDCKKAASKIREAGLPEPFADRLLAGT